jgi:hypothetical protein
MKVRPARYPLRPIRGRWPAQVETRFGRVFRDDPTVVLDPLASDEGFRAAMQSFSMGETIKITRSDRHPEVDQLLLDHVDFTSAHILDIGASDGSTSVDLIRRLPDFERFTIADLHLHADASVNGKRTVFFQADGEAFLCAGRRLIAWPGESRVVRALYRREIERARRDQRESVLLIGPGVRRLAHEDPRVVFAVHDVFQPWSGDQVDVIKVANLLRLDYFPPDRLVAAFGAILESLSECGHLLVVNNLRTGRIEAGGRCSERRQDTSRWWRVRAVDLTSRLWYLRLAIDADSVIGHVGPMPRAHLTSPAGRLLAMEAVVGDRIRVD